MEIINMAKKDNQRELRKNFIESLYSTLDGVVSPTPYLEVVEGDKVDVRFLDGRGRLPSKDTTEVTVLDIDLASLFFDDFHVLYEGVTGVGKTYTSDALFDAVFGPDGHRTLRLSGGVLGSSALEPFTTTILENGVPKTKIDPEKCQKYGALFIDEINRGDSQEVFQVVDGKINVNGDTGYLRVPIIGTGRYKGLAIIAAMNPADAEHSAATELDIAGENRFLKFKFPNGVGEAGSSQLEKKLSGDLHDQFWGRFKKGTGMEGTWKEIYPVVADPESIPNKLDGETREFIDVALGYVGYDPKETFERNKDLMNQGDVEPIFSVREDNDYKKILESQGRLKHGFVRRDLRKIRDLSRLLGFIRGVKDGSYDISVGLNDVAAGMGVILESKTVTGTDHGSLMALVNDARKAYNGLHNDEAMKIPQGYGMRQAVWQVAVHAGQKHGFDAYMNTLKQGINSLNTQTSGQAQVAIKSRVLADLVALEHFSKSHEEDVKSALKEKGEEAFKAFEEVYDKKKGSASVYEHRLGSIMR